MPDDTIWVLPPHTAAKHVLLQRYLEAWYPIMGGIEKKVAYIDGFAGPGRYAGGEPGSPIVALTTLLDHARLEHLDCRFIFVFIEADAARATQLQHEIGQLVEERGGLPPKVTWFVDQRTFVDATRDFLDDLGPGQRVIPTLALVDPFGFAGVPIEQIAELLRWPKCEVIFNFMFDAVNRWVTAGNLDRALDALFGCTDYRDAPASGEERRNFLVELYKRQLETVGKFTYVRKFEMVTRGRRTGNYLFYGTRNETGLRRMKEAMWRLDPQQGLHFTPPDEHGALSLFEGADPDLSELRAGLRAAFAGQTVAIEAVQRFTRIDTRFMDGHLKRRTLKPMQEAGEILSVKGQRRPGEFPPGCVIRFA